ncbi:hypothetical protein GCM10010339_22780 [Streptomyces alanosinicus]|uniref:Nuclear transport factor 2 family protein n=2 Tax=Streptomyces alanosinicus TaxID=68171 RepID=A0A919D2W3_9ACTN|nr:hypothetical protein GCM10010339_22780 [Streptomyces alanosinicus]
MTPRIRRTLAALAVSVVLPLGAAACAVGQAHGGADSPSPIGKVLDDTDSTGRHLREVDTKNAPEVEVEVAPHSGGGWDVRLAFRHFRCSAPGAGRRAVPGRGFVHLLVDGREVTALRTRAYRLPDRLVPHGTHHVTARLYADDGTVWAVRRQPVQGAADITVSDAATATDEPSTATDEPSVTTTTLVVMK